MPEPKNNYQVARSDGSEFTGMFTGTLREAALWGATLAADLGWGEDWQLEERNGRHVVATPSATGPGYVLLFED